MNAKLIYSVLLFSFLLLSCNHSGKDKQVFDVEIANIEKKESPLQDNSNKKQRIPIGNANQNSTDSIATQLPLQAAAHTDWDQKIIKTAILKFEVKISKAIIIPFTIL